MTIWSVLALAVAVILVVIVQIWHRRITQDHQPDTYARMRELAARRWAEIHPPKGRP